MPSFLNQFSSKFLWRAVYNRLKYRSFKTADPL